MVKYRQIADEIRKKIADGEFYLGRQLPLEKELCVQYGVSRITIKRSIDELVKLGVVVKRRGSGTFVKSVDDEEFKNFRRGRQFSGFTEINHGREIYTEVLQFSIVHPDGEIAEKLQIPPDDFVYDIIRTRYVDGRPIVIEYTKMPIQLLPGIKKDILEKSIYAYIQDELKLKIQSAHRAICAVMPNEIEKKELAIQEVLPLLEIKQTAFLDDGRAFEYSISHHRADEITFKTVSMCG